MSQPEDRHVLRPEHFSVAPQLLGLLLASPSRRLVALLIDLVLVALCSQMGSVALAIAAAFAFFRFASRSQMLGKASGRPWRKRMWLMRTAGAFLLFLVVRKGVNQARSAASHLSVIGSTTEQAAPDSAEAPDEAEETRDVSLGSALQAVGGIAALHNADTPDEAATITRRLVKSLRATGASDQDIREGLESALEGSEKPWLREIVSTTLAAEIGGEPAQAPAESLAVWHAAALARHDSAAADSLRPRLASALARDSLDQLHGEVAELQEASRALTRRAEQAEKRGVLAAILQTLDELGIGFGWTGLYFTALTTLWRGQTPGKRLMGIRVIRLNGEPMTLWVSFERFGGYAAGLFTGLLGFAQVFWDRNRQAIHDKITETVVVRELPVARAMAPPPPAAERPRFRAPTA
jgi:hypothetical protein